MTLPPDSGNPLDPPARDEEVSAESASERRFAALESQLTKTPGIGGRIARKHWPRAEREQYPFWIGILVIAVLGIAGMYRTYTFGGHWVPPPTLIALLMVVGLAVVVGCYIRSLQGRFTRQWAAIVADGELFRFLRDVGVVLGYPVEMGRPDEQFSTHLELAFPEGVRVAETYLRTFALPEPVPPDAPPSLHVPAFTLEEHAGSETHRVYDVEYRGSIIRGLSVRVASSDGGSDVTVSFTLRPSNAETRDRMVNGLVGRLQDRFIAAKILADIRDAAGLPATPVPAVETEEFTEGAQPSAAI